LAPAGNENWYARSTSLRRDSRGAKAPPTFARCLRFRNADALRGDPLVPFRVVIGVVDEMNSTLHLQDRGGIPALFPDDFYLGAGGVLCRLDRFQVLRRDPRSFGVFVTDEVDFEFLVARIHDSAGVPIAVLVLGFRALAYSWMSER